jgi:hypothetical protein
VEKDWCVVHLVLENGKTLVMVEVNLAQKFKFIARAFKQKLSVWSDMAGFFIFMLLIKDFF